MSDTPLTDAEQSISDCGQGHVNADFARTLERRCAELAALRIGYERYECLRRLNPQMFKVLWLRNVHGANFDALVDEMRGAVRDE